jgi:glycine/D-amino acid oxidase-like deaminating enzyme
MAPVAGKLVARLAAGERPDINLSAHPDFLQNLPLQTFDFTANMVMRMPL